MFNEGLYSIDFAASSGSAEERGDALAILRGGRILGSDRHGGVFEGQYRFDPARLQSQFKIRIRVPAQRELVTGFSAGAEETSVEVTAVMNPETPVAHATVDLAGRPLDLRFTYLGPVPN